jgi:chromatin remodeling complex protein RSC6
LLREATKLYSFPSSKFCPVSSITRGLAGREREKRERKRKREREREEKKKKRRRRRKREGGRMEGMEKDRKKEKEKRKNQLGRMINTVSHKQFPAHPSTLKVQLRLCLYSFQLLLKSLTL